MKQQSTADRSIKKADWKDYLISVLIVIALPFLLMKLKEYTSGYALFLMYAVVGCAVGVVIGAALYAMKQGRALPFLSAALFAVWLVLPAEREVMSGLVGCAVSALIISLPALALWIAAVPSGRRE